MSTRSSWRTPRSPISRANLWNRPKAKEAFRQGRRPGPRPPAGGVSPDTLRPVLRRPPSRQLPRADRRTHRQSCSLNEAEILSLYSGRQAWTQALDAVRGECGLAVVTRSGKGSIVLEGTQVFEFPAEPIAKVEDTTGAGRPLLPPASCTGCRRGQAPRRMCAARRDRGGPRSSAISVPARRSASPIWSARSSRRSKPGRSSPPARP